jgi:hypothetical protein
MDSLAERALCVIESRLKQIRTDSGYKTDTGEKILRARRKLSADECPAAVIWDIGDIIDNAGDNRDVLDLEVHVEAHVPANQNDTGVALEAVKADVKRAIRPKDKKGNIADEQGQIGAIRYNGAQCFEREDGAATESITLKFLIRLTEIAGDPSSSK